jgi:hypothetical protein
MSNSVYHNFPNIGYLRHHLTSEELTPVWNEIKKIEKNFETSEKFNTELAGNIKKEYLLIDNFSYIEDLLIGDARNFIQHFNYDKDVNVNNQTTDICLINTWVNFQKKYEFNPSHNHAGVISFVIWMKIPYKSSEEKMQGPGAESNTNVPGHFEFSYTDTLGQIKSLLIACDESMEGTILMFPSRTIHAVYPFFTSDDYRITVSGNFSFKII